MLALHVCVESIVDGKLSCQSLFVRESYSSESLCNRAQADSFRRNLFLPLHIGRSHNKPESLHCGIGNRVVLNDRLESTSRAAMVKFDCFNFGRVEGSGTLSLGLIWQIFFLNKQELRLGVNE